MLSELENLLGAVVQKKDDELRERVFKPANRQVLYSNPVRKQYLQFGCNLEINLEPLKVVRTVT